jgi:dihydrofolate synthase/folylpolyglutamate synthase
VVSVITRIDFDHENFLGHSLPEIAGEKMGIVKHGVAVVSSAQLEEVRELVRARAKEMHSPLVEVEEAFWLVSERAEGGCVRATVRVAETGEELRISPCLPGRFQLQNALNATAATRVLQARGFRITNENVERGIASAVWPGRLERLQERPDIYLDGAHNPGAARELAKFLEENFAGRRVVLLYGAMRDKAVDEVSGILFPHATEVIFTQAGTPRAVSAAQLAEMAGHHAAKFSVIADAEKALETALGKAGREDTIFVTGSLYLVGQLRHAWKARSAAV